MPNPRNILVTGASGQLGHRIVELLLEKGGDHVIAASRSTDKLSALKGAEPRVADFDKPETLDKAFAGVERLLIVSTDALDVPGRRLRQHENAVAAAKRAGVKHIVYTSLPNPGPESLITAIAPDHHGTEQAIEQSGIEHTILRNNMYIDLFIGGLAHAAATGELHAAAGEGRVGYVTREDCARAAAAALQSHDTGSRTLDVTGPAALSRADLAAVLSEVTGKKVKYTAVTAEQQTQGLLAAGVPAPFATILVQFDSAAAKGQLDVATDAVKKLTGKAPTSVKEFLEAHRAELTQKT